MTTEPELAQPDAIAPALEPTPRSEVADAPAVLDWGGARRVFGRGLNDINEWNDPC